jgi:hypothetical protein
MFQAWRSARGPMLLWLLPLGILFSVQGWAGETRAGGGLGNVSVSTPATTCSPGGSSSASNCSSGGGFVRTLPGTVCTMNVGNNNYFSQYTNKIRNCDEARQRLQGIAGLQCDVINIIELNTKAQCRCACDPNNTCTPVTNPDGTYGGCIDNPARPEICKADGFGYYEPERCELCQGCGAGEPVSCEAQARILCDPANYEEPYCNQVAHKGCDCMCVRKGPCVPPPERCEEKVITGPMDCDSGNYAICRKCDYDNDNVFDWGSCVAHPTHCIPTPAWEGGLDACLERCSTPILKGAAEFIADAKVRTISGDFNCDPDGCSWFGTCPWVDLMKGYGLEVCNHSDGTTVFGCRVDLVLSNSCGCASQENIEPSPGDHFTIAFNTGARIWTAGNLEVLSAESASSCPDPDQRSSTSDQLGRGASCPTTENGQPVGSCSSWGHLKGKVHYYTRADTCGRPDPPQVLVCETATTLASATCTANASSGSSAFVTMGQAESSQAATCVNGVPYNPEPRVVTKADFVVPDLVIRADGNLYYHVERDLSRDHGAQCSAALRQGTCATPVNPLASAPLMVDACASVPNTRE